MKTVTVALLLVLIAVSAVHAELYRVLSWDDGSVTVELNAPEPVVTELGGEGKPRICRVHIPGFAPLELEGMPIVPWRRFLFAVTAPSGIRLDLLEREVLTVEGVVPVIYSAEPVPIDRQREMIRSLARDGEEFLRLADVGMFRGTNLAVVEFTPLVLNPSREGLLYAKRVVMRLSFPPAREGTAIARPDRSLEGVLVNTDQASGWRAGPLRRMLAQRTPFEFSRSDNWLKIRVSDTGVHLITYNDLLVAGVNPNNIDPETMRLFSATPLQQPDSVGSGGSFEESYHLVEHAIGYRGSASWEGDSILFYGVGIEGWMNILDPAAEPSRRYEHLYEKENVYWLTWGGTFTGDPLRFEERDVAPHGGAPDIIAGTYEERIHVEKDVQYDPIHTGDRWYWVRMNVGGSTSFTHSFYCTELPQGEERGRGRIVTIGYGPYVPNHSVNSARYYINGSIVDTLSWIIYAGSFVPDILDEPISNLVEGKNTFMVQKDVDDAAYVFSYDVLYRRRLVAQSGMLDFFAPRETGTARFTMTDFPSGGKLLLDVTDHENPVLLTGWQGEGSNITIDDDLDGSPRHYLATTVPSLKKPSIELAGSRIVPLPSLRDDAVCPDMLIIYHERFRNAVLALKTHREAHLPYAENPVVKSVDIEHVYDNFSCGLKDPLAIRNYIKFLYDNFTNGGEPVLRYVLLVGNGTHDPKDIVGAGTDLIPFYMNIQYYYYNEAIEDDDFLVKMDEGNDRYVDLAIGRLTVLTVQEANRWIERIIDYETSIEQGTWKNKIVLVADDEYSSTTESDFLFLRDAESMSLRRGVFPRFVDFKKIYLHFYPFVGGGKPGARDDLIEEWSDGALILNYAGHGSHLQMADELVMVKSDVFSLTNGNLRPLYLSFSCHVGDLEEPTKRSLAQELVLYDEGGAIASISGTSYTSGIQNSAMNYVFFNQLFTSRDSTGTEPVGVALQLSKITGFNRDNWRNNVMYVLLGDPALTLAFPMYTVEHDIAAVDTMYTGRRYRIDGFVRMGGGVMTSFNGTAEIIVQEAEEHVDKYVLRDSTLHNVEYVLHGNGLYKGTVDVTSGRFSCEFVVPLRCRTGPNARVRSYVYAAGMDGVGASDTLLIIPSGSVPDNEAPPSIHMYFAGQATKVKQGAKLIAEIFDKDGVAILGTDPQSSIYLEFDKSGYPIFVTDYFEYDHGSSMQGSVEYPLHSGFSPGPHTVVLRAFDNLGVSSSDTLSFEVVEEGLYSVSDVFNMPNPFSESTNFIFQTSSRAEVHFSIYNLSGIRVWERRISVEEGFNSIYWDGRDSAGDRLANGTYIYVLDVEFADSFHRSEEVTGKVVLLR
jgi:hypothetical protein